MTGANTLIRHGVSVVRIAITQGNGRAVLNGMCARNCKTMRSAHFLWHFLTGVFQQPMNSMNGNLQSRQFVTGSGAHTVRQGFRERVAR